MTLFVDTSVWSLALRRDKPVFGPEVQILIQSLGNGSALATTGLILQELLQGFAGPSATAKIITHFNTIPFLTPEKSDHIAAAEIRNLCRRAGTQVGKVDAIIAQLCLRYDLTLLTTDGDFKNMAKHVKLKLWH